VVNISSQGYSIPLPMDKKPHENPSLTPFLRYKHNDLACSRLFKQYFDAISSGFILNQGQPCRRIKNVEVSRFAHRVPGLLV
jgi:hypothetical protein